MEAILSVICVIPNSSSLEWYCLPSLTLYPSFTVQAQFNLLHDFIFLPNVDYFQIFLSLLCHKAYTSPAVKNINIKQDSQTSLMAHSKLSVSRGLVGLLMGWLSGPRSISEGPLLWNKIVFIPQHSTSCLICGVVWGNKGRYSSSENIIKCLLSGIWA